MRPLKLLLICLSLGFFALSANAGETRYFGYDPTGQLMLGPVVNPIHPEPSPGQAYVGTLTTARLGLIGSVHPYAHSNGIYEERPEIVDDLMYESLLLEDPSLMSERMFPLIASGVRVAEDLSYVTFEIDSRARFNDGLAIHKFCAVGSAPLAFNLISPAVNAGETEIRSATSCSIESGKALLI